MDVNEARRMRALEEENARLTRLGATRPLAPAPLAAAGVRGGHGVLPHPCGNQININNLAEFQF